MRNGMSDKERALIAAARRDLEKMRSGAAETASPQPAPAMPIDVPPMTATAIKRPDASAPKGENATGNTSPDAIAMRIAVLMEAEREEKARRLKSHQRWKTGAIGFFVALAGWWALTIISHLRH
jgi:hypothetical protein